MIEEIREIARIARLLPLEKGNVHNYAAKLEDLARELEEGFEELSENEDHTGQIEDLELKVEKLEDELGCAEDERGEFQAEVKRLKRERGDLKRLYEAVEAWIDELDSEGGASGHEVERVFREIRAPNEEI